MEYIRYLTVSGPKIYFVIILLVCIILTIMSIWHVDIPSGGSSEKFVKFNLDVKPVIYFKDNAHFLLIRILHFICVFVFCFIVSALLTAYSGYWDYFGIKSFLTILSGDNYFPTYVYIIISITSLFGAILIFGSVNRSILYKRLACWFFPTGILCSLLGGTGLTRGMPGNNGMGDGIMVITSLPLFLEFFILAYVISGIVCWIWRRFNHR